MIDPRDAVLNVGRAMRFVTETHGSNRGEVVDEMIRLTGLDPTTRSPWCAAFVAWVGYAVLRKDWPLQKVAGCVSLYDDARGKGLVGTVPLRGSIFLLWSPTKGRFAHTGFVIDQSATGRYATIEGNTNAGGSPEGTGVFERERVFGIKDRFIYWWDAL